MPSFVPHDAARFELPDGAPVLRLAVEPPQADESGWSLLNTSTLCVVDGPNDAGYLIARVAPDGGDTAPTGWDAAVERAAGSLVVFGTGAHSPGFFVSSAR